MIRDQVEQAETAAAAVPPGFRHRLVLFRVPDSDSIRPIGAIKESQPNAQTVQICHVESSRVAEDTLRSEGS